MGVVEAAAEGEAEGRLWEWGKAAGAGEKVGVE